MIKAPINKFVVVNKEVETSLGDFMIDPDGRDVTIEAEVIAAGNNISDVKIGDIIIYPKSRGIKSFYEGKEVTTVDYGSMNYFKTQEDE